MDLITTTEPGADVLAVRGEIDADNCALLERALQDIEPSGDRLVLDARDLSFIDSSGISVLLRARSALLGDDVRLEIREPTEPVRRVLEITGLLELFHVD